MPYTPGYAEGAPSLYTLPTSVAVDAAGGVYVVAGERVRRVWWANATTDAFAGASAGSTVLFAASVSALKSGHV